MTHEQREFFMKQIAFYFQMNHITEIHFRSLSKYIRRQFPGLKTFRELDYFEADVRTCTFLVRDPLGNYSFVHRSFGEYFAARCAVDFFVEGEWPEYLWKGKSYNPSSWITPETARFVIDIIDKNNYLEKILSYLYSTYLNGILFLNILSVFKFSNQKKHREVFDIIHWLHENNKMRGVGYRIELASLAKEHHTNNWKSIGRKLKRFY